MSAPVEPIAPIRSVEQEHPWLYFAYAASFTAFLLLSFL